jgi:hypothetical protein
MVLHAHISPEGRTVGLLVATDQSIVSPHQHDDHHFVDYAMQAHILDQSPLKLAIYTVSHNLRISNYTQDGSFFVKCLRLVGMLICGGWYH